MADTVTFSGSVVGLLSGVVGGFLSGTFVEWWRAGRQDLAKLCDEFCGQIAIAADVSADYWLMAGSDPQCLMTESRLYGLQQRISGYNAITCTRLHDDAADWVEVELQKFFDALTGGKFQDPSRTPDIAAAHKAQDQGAQAILAVRRGAYETASFKESAYRWMHFKR